MEQRVESLEMRTSILEKDVKILAGSLSELTTSVQKLVVTLDRGKWLGYGILIMAGAQIMGIKELIKTMIGL